MWFKLARALAGFAALCPFGVSAATMDDAMALYQAGKLAEAAAAFRAIAAEAGPEEAGAAHNSACVVLMDLGDYNGALAECVEARRLREQGEDRRGLARTLNNTALALQRLGRHAEAETAYGEALAINRERNDAEAQAVNLRNYALLSAVEGRLSRARQQLDEVMTLVAEHAEEPWAAEQRRLALLNLGVLLEKLGAYEDALATYRELLADQDALEPRHRAALQVNIGVVYRNLGDPVRALAAFEAGVAAYEQVGDVAALSNAWLNLGLVHHLNLHDPAEAEAAYRQALELARQSGDREEESWDGVYLGRLLLENGRLDDAEQTLGAALQVALDSESAEGQWTAREGLGRVAIARGDDAAALGDLLAAIDVIENVRQEAGGEEQRARFFADKRGVYGAAVSVLARLDAAQPDAMHAAQALEIAQRAKARDLVEALGPGASTGVPLDATRLRASAGADLVLEYFTGEGRLYRWSVQQDSIELRDLGPVAPVRTSVESVHTQLRHGEAPTEAILATLSRLLLAGVKLPAHAALYVAPDDALQYLPFELLKLPGSESLLERTTLSYLPSASGLAWLRDRRVEPALELLAFGDVPAPDRATGPGALFEELRLAPLKETARELAAAERYIPEPHRVLTGDDASEAAYRTSAGEAAAIVHVAAHALVDERPGRGAAILLAPGEADDGLLHPDEIVADVHPASLTVLAACRSAADVLGGGRALNNLTGALLASGSKAVLATLWEVDDATTASFMEQFYYEIGRGAGAAEALRSVKRRLSADPAWASPALWSGYVIIGEARQPLVPPRFGTSGIVPIAVIVGLAVMLAAAGAWLARRRRDAGAVASRDLRAGE